VCVVRGCVDRRGLEGCAGIMRDNQATRFAYYFSFLAWLKEVLAIRSLALLRTDYRTAFFL
jgi:hypothetical protein